MVSNLKKHLPGYVGVNELHACGISRYNCGIIGTMELGISYYRFWYKASYCKCPGMKIENWDAATCRTSAQVFTTL